jgi:hypothetical protein
MSFRSDPDKLVSCPYDSSHVIRISKIQNHIIKCEKSHPELARRMKICDFNATHRYLPEDEKDHIENCPDYVRFLNSKAKASIITRSCPLPNYQIPNSNNLINTDTDNWDDECDFAPVKSEPHHEQQQQQQQNRLEVEKESDNPIKRKNFGRGRQF